MWMQMGVRIGCGMGDYGKKVSGLGMRTGQARPPTPLRLAMWDATSPPLSPPDTAYMRFSIIHHGSGVAAVSWL